VTEGEWEMKLTKEQQYYAQKGKKYRHFDGLGNHWDIEVTGVRVHSDGYLFLEYRSMKNNSGTWLEDDGNPLDRFILDVQEERTIEIS